MDSKQMKSMETKTRELETKREEGKFMTSGKYGADRNATRVTDVSVETQA